MKYTKEIKIKAEGETKEDLYLAIQEAVSHIVSGDTSGGDSSCDYTSSYSFNVT